MSKIPVKLLEDFDKALAYRLAPTIEDNQEITCYIGEEMTPYVIQGNNILAIPDISGYKILNNINAAFAEQFAPVIYDGQEFTCYVGEEITPYTVQGDNILVIPEIPSSENLENCNCIHEVHTLTTAEAVSESFTLENSIANGQENNVSLSVCGISQILDVDFSVVSNSITWKDKGLHQIGLASGDVFIIDYVRG